MQQSYPAAQVEAEGEVQGLQPRHMQGSLLSFHPYLLLWVSAQLLLCHICLQAYCPDDEWSTDIHV